MNEVRRVEWPRWEAPEWSDPLQFQQGIAGGLELFFRAWTPFQGFVGELTGHVVPVFQRIDQAGFRLPLDERALADADTLLVFGLDHAVTGQVAAPGGDRGRSPVSQARGNLPGPGPSSRCRSV